MLNFLLTKEKAFDFLSKIFNMITPTRFEAFPIEAFQPGNVYILRFRPPYILFSKRPTACDSSRI